MNLFDLTGKTILVTGASSGIGKQASLTISQQGGTVFLTGRNEQRLSETCAELSGAGHRFLPADLTREADIDRLVEQLPQLNGIVHSAGITGHLPAKFIREKNIREYFDSNYASVLLLTGKILTKKKLTRNGSIVFLSSIASKYPYFGGALYSSTKAALEAYSATLALELAPQGIRCNCLSPTFVKTRMVEDTEKTISKEVLDKFERAHPLGFGEPEDVANAIVFFLSDASRWITGTNLVLGGI